MAWSTGSLIPGTRPARRPPQRQGRPPEPPSPRSAAAPWVNVVANPSFGFIASEAGSGYCWSGNSQTNRLTPWSNDPVTDPPGEVVYLRDEETGEFWSPDPLARPFGRAHARPPRPGLYRFRAAGSRARPRDDFLVPPKTRSRSIHLKVGNPSDRPRQALGDLLRRVGPGRRRDQARDAGRHRARLRDRRPAGPQPVPSRFRDHWPSPTSALRPRTFTADRTEFLGRNGSTAAPAALGRVGLGRAASAPRSTPARAIQVKFELVPARAGGRLRPRPGREPSRRPERRSLQHREPSQAARRPRGGQGTLGRRSSSAVQVQTPDPAFDLLLNRWLLYQVLSCRFWGRSAFYQSGGAYGFRDQLQDVMALVHAAPARDPSASTSCRGGPPVPRRRRAALVAPPLGPRRPHPDLRRLPLAALVVCHYVDDDRRRRRPRRARAVPRRPAAGPGQEDDYGLPAVSTTTGTLYEHCARALEHGLRSAPTACR